MPWSQASKKPAVAQHPVPPVPWMQAAGPVGPVGVGGQAGSSPVQAPNAGPTKVVSDQRFRSFAERWMVARCHLFRVDPEGLAEDTWNAVLDAKKAYQMIERSGRNIEPDFGLESQQF